MIVKNVCPVCHKESLLEPLLPKEYVINIPCEEHILLFAV